MDGSTCKIDLGPNSSLDTWLHTPPRQKIIFGSNSPFFVYSILLFTKFSSKCTVVEVNPKINVIIVIFIVWLKYFLNHIIFRSFTALTLSCFICYYGSIMYFSVNHQNTKYRKRVHYPWCSIFNQYGYYNIKLINWNPCIHQTKCKRSIEASPSLRCHRFPSITN